MDTPFHKITSVVEHWYHHNHKFGVSPENWEALSLTNKQAWLESYKDNPNYKIDQYKFISILNSFCDVYTLPLISVLSYDDLEIGEFYVGLYKYSPYYFKYLGNGGWTGGNSNFSNISKIKNSTAVYKPNTYNIVPICKLSDIPKDNLTWTHIVHEIIHKEVFDLYLQGVVLKSTGTLIKPTPKVIRYINEA